MNKVKAIFKSTLKPFFTDGMVWMECRELTVDDFIVTVTEKPKEYVMKSLMSNWDVRSLFTVNIKMKDEIIEMLDAQNYFKNRGNIKLAESPESRQAEMTTRIKEVPMMLTRKTSTGGVIRSEAKILDMIDKAFADSKETLEALKDALVVEMLEAFNKQVNGFIEDNNKKFEGSVLGVLTNRDDLNKILSHNEDSESIGKIKTTHDSSLSTLDDEIEKLNAKIKELEDEKTKIYVNTSKELFSEEIDENLPTELKERVLEGYEEGTSFNKLRGLFR